MRFFGLFLASIALIAAKAEAQPTLMLLDPSGSAIFSAIVLTDAGSVYSTLYDPTPEMQFRQSILYQAGLNPAPNVILSEGGLLGGEVVSGLAPIERYPLSPVFGSDNCLLNVTTPGLDDLPVGKLAVISPAGLQIHSIRSDNAAFSSIQDPIFGRPAGAAVPGNLGGKLVALDNYVFGGFVAPNGMTGAETSQLFTVNFKTMPLGKIEFVDFGYVPDAQATNGFDSGHINTFGMRSMTGNDLSLWTTTFPIAEANRPEGTSASDAVYAHDVVFDPDAASCSSAHERVVLPAAINATNPWDAMPSAPLSILNPFETWGFTSRSVAFAGLTQFDSEVSGVPRAGIATTSSAAGAGSCDCGAADLDGDGGVDSDDAKIAAACAFNDPNGAQCKDVNGDGAIDMKDWECVQHCITKSAGEGKGLDPGFSNPGGGIVLLENNLPVPGDPASMVLGFTAVRGNVKGYAAFAVNVMRNSVFGVEVLALSAASPLRSLVKKGDNFGDGAIVDIGTIGNINDQGEIAVAVGLEGGNSAIYRFQIGSGEENGVGDSLWTMLL